MKILVINLTRMGDILQSSPLLWGLKEKYPNCEIHYLASIGFDGILKNIPFIDKKIVVDVADIIERSIELKADIISNYKYFEDLINYLQSQNYDLVMNITHTDESKALSYLVNGKKTIGITMDNRGYRLVKHPWENYFYASNLNQQVNRINLVDVYLRLGNINTSPHNLFFIPTDDGYTKYNEIASNYNLSENKYFCVQLGASVENKQYTPEMFAKAINLIYKDLQLLPVFVGTDKENALYEECRKYLEVPNVSLMGKTNIDTLGVVLKNAKLLLTNDTGTMHIASGVGTKIVCIALATAYSHETAAYSEGNVIVEADIPCSPCSHHVTCLNPICKGFIKPEYLYTIVKNLDALSKGYQIDEIQNFPKVRVYVSKFDKNNFITLYPLIKKDITYEDVFNHILKNMWIATLGSEDWEVNFKKIEDIDIDTFNELKPWYNTDVMLLNNSKLKNDIEALIKLENLSKQGYILTEKMFNAFKSSNIQLLKDLSYELQKVDDDIVNIGMANSRIRPITFMFHFGKDNLEESSIDIMLDRTKILYTTLDYRSRFLIHFLNTIK